MASLDNLFTANVFRNTLFPAQVGFGTPLILGYHQLYLDRRRTYFDLAGVEAAGFTSTAGGDLTQIWRHAKAIFDQSPHVNKIMIGRMGVSRTKTLRIFPKTAASGEVYTFVVRDNIEARNPITRTVPPASSIAAECTAIAAAIDALPLVVATATATYVEITASTATGFVRVDELPSADKLEVLDVTADPGVATDLSAIEAVDKTGWYAIDVVSASKAEALAVVGWVESRKKLFLYDTIDSDNQAVGITTGILSQTKAANRLRSRGTYYQTASDPAHSAALMGFKMAVNPDTASTSWEYATLSGIPFDNVTDNQVNEITLRNGGVYAEIGSEAVELNSKTAAGEWLDTVLGLDWFQSRIKTDYFGAVKNANNSGGKVGYTNAGGKTLQGIAEIRVRSAIRTNLIDGERPWSVTVTPVEDIDPATRQARRFQSVTIKFFLQGAVHTAEINIYASV